MGTATVLLLHVYPAQPCKQFSTTCHSTFIQLYGSSPLAVMKLRMLTRSLATYWLLLAGFLACNSLAANLRFNILQTDVCQNNVGISSCSAEYADLAEEWGAPGYGLPANGQVTFDGSAFQGLLFESTVPFLPPEADFQIRVRVRGPFYSTGTVFHISSIATTPTPHYETYLRLRMSPYSAFLEYNPDPSSGIPSKTISIRRFDPDLGSSATNDFPDDIFVVKQGHALALFSSRYVTIGTDTVTGAGYVKICDDLRSDSSLPAATHLVFGGHRVLTQPSSYGDEDMFQGEIADFFMTSPPVERPNWFLPCRTDGLTTFSCSENTGRIDHFAFYFDPLDATCKACDLSCKSCKGPSESECTSCTSETVSGGIGIHLERASPSIMANASVKMVILDGMHCIPVFHATPAVQRATGVLAGTASRAPTLALEQ